MVKWEINKKSCYHIPDGFNRSPKRTILISKRKRKFNIFIILDAIIYIVKIIHSQEWLLIMGDILCGFSKMAACLLLFPEMERAWWIGVYANSISCTCTADNLPYLRLHWLTVKVSSKHFRSQKMVSTALRRSKGSKDMSLRADVSIPSTD